MTENDISYKIRGAIYKVYNNLGPGLLESIYVLALRYELQKENLNVKIEVPIPIYYEGIELEAAFRIDLLIENKVIIEVKSVEAISKTHHKQLLTYLKLTEMKLGILVNFNVSNINEGIFRKINTI